MVESGPKSLFETESTPLFRADTDHNGDWHVWRQMSTNGWATLRRCDTRDAAVRIADRMNADLGLIGPNC